ncbi:MAG: glycosyltransferase [Candidatus Moranbacteria bacterium]|jgi:glycosyltransferase involved in cell wall biosynthesis|nr:glycosyltransferase [Candidatus Moranbacteria bacterium]
MKNRELKIFILNHANKKSGSVNYLEAYLLRKGYFVSRLSHPLDKYENESTFFYENLKEITRIQRRKMSIYNFIKDIYISLKYLKKTKFDVFIGANNFDTLSGILVKYILRKRVKKIIFFASDYSEDRFHKNWALNQVYYLIEIVALKYSDIVISNTKRAERARIKLGLKKEKSMVIPNGIFIDEPEFIKKDIKKDKFIYVGSVTKEHGLFDLLNVLHSEIKKLVIIGQGDDWERVLDLCKDKNINVETHYQKSHEFVLEYLKKFDGIGLAPYNLQSKWTYYCSPSKVGEYVACGIPVFMSNVPEIAKFIKDNSLGIVFDKMEISVLKMKIKNFRTDNFYFKARDFYLKFNRDYLYEKVI